MSNAAITIGTASTAASLGAFDQGLTFADETSLNVKGEGIVGRQITNTTRTVNVITVVVSALVFLSILVWFEFIRAVVFFTVYIEIDHKTHRVV